MGIIQGPKNQFYVKSKLIYNHKPILLQSPTQNVRKSIIFMKKHVCPCPRYLKNCLSDFHEIWTIGVSALPND